MELATIQPESGGHAVEHAPEMLCGQIGSHKSPEQSHHKYAMCLGSCSRFPDGWPAWPIAACGRHARFRLNDRPSAGLHGGPSASCGYAPVIQAQGSLARVGRLINHHFRQNPHGHLFLFALGWMRAAPLACRPPCALHLFSIWFLHLALALPNFRELAPTIPDGYYGLHPDPRQCRGKTAHVALTSAVDLLPMQSGDSAVAGSPFPTDTRSGRQRYDSQGPRCSQRQAAAGRMAAQ